MQWDRHSCLSGNTPHAHPAGAIWACHPARVPLLACHAVPIRRSALCAYVPSPSATNCICARGWSFIQCGEYTLVCDDCQPTMHRNVELADGQNHRSLGTKSPGLRQRRKEFWLKAIFKSLDSRLRVNDMVEGSRSRSLHPDAIRCSGRGLA